MNPRTIEPSDYRSVTTTTTTTTTITTKPTGKNDSNNNMLYYSYNFIAICKCRKNTGTNVGNL